MKNCFSKLKQKMIKYTNQAVKINYDFIYIHLITGMYIYKIKKINGKYIIRKRKRMWPALLYFACKF